MKNNGKYIVGLIILILVLVFGAGIIIVNRSSTARRIQVVYIPKARDDANDFWTSLLKGAQMAANEYDVDLTILAPGIPSRILKPRCVTLMKLSP